MKYIDIKGSFKVYHGGFKDMRVTLQKIDGSDQLPIAHTCFNRLDLPTYKSRE